MRSWSESESPMSIFPAGEEREDVVLEPEVQLQVDPRVLVESLVDTHVQRRELHVRDVPDGQPHRVDARPEPRAGGLAMETARKAGDNRRCCPMHERTSYRMPRATSR